ncbi:putative drug exporter of the RND superfamily [Paenibacillus sp. UNC496MF]|uniref:MMPL family transporter n=1 Tax=Paenibacillus sp. UNC496MF TaxID=1502753 RepID=UPI0008F2C34B|nr:MMPL family transporter [Paenibacillus sp. UNC496MF]SFJ04006.1 putative drug exporter of the RND superfamily [Paenibacillus sp. UNC496MF]
MSTFLYKIGRSAYDKPWAFIVGWVVILAVVLAALGANGIHVSSDMKIEGTESQKVLDQLAAELPEASGGQASVVFAAPAGERLDTAERLAALRKAVDDVYRLDHVINPAELAAKAGVSDGAQAGAQAGDSAAAGARQGAEAGAQGDAAAAAGLGTGGANASAAGQAPYGPLVVDGAPVPGVMIARDGSVALFQFQFTVQQMSLPESVPDRVIQAVSAVEKTGIQALPSDSLSTKPALGSTEGVGLVVAAVVLLMTLGSVVAAGLPLLSAILGVGISVGGAYAFSKFIPMTDITPALALMVGLAVGIDYSLFIVNRQRRMILDQGLSAREAASRAVGTAGSAVFFAGLTVIIALCGMLVIGIAFLSTMALVAAAAVLANVLIALTLLPALLGLAGERICSAKARAKRAGQSSEPRHGFARRWAAGAIKLRWPIVVAAIAVLGVAAIPVAKMEMGIPSGATANLDTTSRQSYDAISQGFGEGFNGPLLLVAEPKNGAAIGAETLGKLAQELQQHEDVSLVTPMGVNKTGDMAIISLIPKSGPTDAATKRLVHDLRAPDSKLAQTYGVAISVTGFTAINLDMSAKLAEVFPLYVGIIVVLSLIILLLVFRSVIVPVKATVGFLLSVLATFGITTAVYQWGWLHALFGFDTGGPLLSFMPIMVTGILYGLAMDYQVFLVSSMREAYVHGHHGRSSVVHGYEQASRVVVAAAVIMVSVFAGFIFAPDIMIKQIGFALAVGILIDAFVVRMTLVPAVMAVFGDRAWRLPKWLDRLLPNLDVEGEKLIAELKAKDDASPRTAFRPGSAAAAGISAVRDSSKPSGVRRPGDS